MKTVWEVTDIQCGRRVEPANGAFEPWIIVYEVQSYTGGTGFGLVCLVDGFISHRDKSKEEMVGVLNEMEMVPT